MTTLLRIIELEYDFIEIHHNPLLKNKPYLVRVFNYNNQDPTELRLNDIKDLLNILKANGLILS